MRALTCERGRVHVDLNEKTLNEVERTLTRHDVKMTAI